MTETQTAPVEGKKLWNEMARQWLSEGGGNWTETTKEQFDESLNIVPPAVMYRSSFLKGEPFWDNVFAAFVEHDGKCYAKYMTPADYKRWTAEGMTVA